MSKKLQKLSKIILALICCVIVLTGCGGSDRFGRLPDNPIVFEHETYQDPDNADDTYACIVYGGRTYVPYGTLDGRIDKSVVKECIGYIRDRENPGDTSMRVYTLKGDDGVNYLMNSLTEAIMEQPSFYRAVDTNGEDIYTPEFIDPLDYDCWK